MSILPFALSCTKPWRLQTDEPQQHSRRHHLQTPAVQRRHPSLRLPPQPASSASRATPAPAAGVLGSGRRRRGRGRPPRARARSAPAAAGAGEPGRRRRELGLGPGRRGQARARTPPLPPVGAALGVGERGLRPSRAKRTGAARELAGPPAAAGAARGSGRARPTIAAGAARGSDARPSGAPDRVPCCCLLFRTPRAWARSAPADGRGQLSPGRVGPRKDAAAAEACSGP